MNTTNNPCPAVSFTQADGDTTKLLSLLALATGAVVMPQTSNADILFTDLSASPIVVGANNSASFSTDNLPGLARLGFEAHSKATAITSSRYVLVGQIAGYVRIKTNSFFAVPSPAGMTWNQISGNPSNVGTVGYANYYRHNPNSFDHLYLAFRFKDTTQAGTPFRYGWLQLSLDNPPSGNGPDVTIYGYAFDNTGATIAMGSVPEPSSAALLVLGALTLGAKGLRSWRRGK